MKGYDQRGFVFYSNYDSRKGRELQQNGFASLCFWWEPLHRSVTRLLPCHSRAVTPAVACYCLVLTLLSPCLLGCCLAVYFADTC